MIRRRKPINRTNPKRAQKALNGQIPPTKRTAKGKLKAQQRLAYKIAYCKAFGHKENDDFKAPCQQCGTWIWIRQSDFSHKVPAGRGGDVGGVVQATNGIYSCRPCHEFVEQDQIARQELIASPANTQDGGRVWFTAETHRRHRLYLLKRSGFKPSEEKIERRQI